MSSKNLTNPVLDSISMEVLPHEDEKPIELARQLLEEVVGAILQRPVDNWTIAPVEETVEPNDFDLVAPEVTPNNPGEEVSSTQAWEIVHTLEAHDRVAWADADFEVVVDDEEEEAPALPPEPLADGGPPSLPADWSPELIEAPASWDLTPPHGGGKKYGEGIRIAHPDSGHLNHTELFDPAHELKDRVQLNLGADFVDDSNPPIDHDPVSGHGLGTSSVIMSADNRASRRHSVTGVAPKATLVPIRVARRRKLIKVPTPVLLRGGMRRLKKALYYAAQSGCHIVSISLGGLANKGVEKAIRHAHQNNIIVCAAAGNRVRFVVWPAAYDDTIAVAGCNYRRKEWSGSSRGKKVDVTGPAEDVWKARNSTNTSGKGEITTSSGTSFAVASTAGIAALWLAYHGRDRLLSKYSGVSLGEVFRKVIRDSSDPPPNNNGKWGAGIINARKALAMNLPSSAEVAGGDTAAAAPDDPLEQVFDDLAVSGARERFQSLIGGASPVADAATAPVPSRSDELLFHLLSNQDLRDYVFQGADVDAGDTTTAPPVDLLPLENLSPQLRATL